MPPPGEHDRRLLRHHRIGGHRRPVIADWIVKGAPENRDESDSWSKTSMRDPVQNPGGLTECVDGRGRGGRAGDAPERWCSLDVDGGDTAVRRPVAPPRASTVDEESRTGPNLHISRARVVRNPGGGRGPTGGGAGRRIGDRGSALCVVDGGGQQLAVTVSRTTPPAGVGRTGIHRRCAIAGDRVMQRALRNAAREQPRCAQRHSAANYRPRQHPDCGDVSTDTFVTLGCANLLLDRQAKTNRI